MACLARCGAFILLFAGSTWFVTRAGTPLLVLVAAALAAPAALALLHRSTVRRLSRMHEYAPGHWLHAWAGRRIVGQFAATGGALVLSLAVLVQSPFFGWLEWALVAVAPLMFLGFATALSRRLRPGYSRPVYAASATLRLARWLTFVLLCLAWLVGRFLQADAPLQPVAQVAYQLQNEWPATPSTIVRWAIDANAWGQAILASIGHASAAPWWRVALALAILPLTLFGFVTWSVAGLAIGREEWRRIFARTLTDAAQAPSAARKGVVTAAGIAAAVCFGALAAGVYGDIALRESGRVLALRALPQCERLGGVAYVVGTFAKVDAYHAVLERGIVARKHDACGRVAALRGALERQVDHYLDWYFSLGADYLQTLLLAAGETDGLLEFKLAKLVAGDPRVTTLIGELDADADYIAQVSAAARTGIGELLERQRLVLHEGQCRVVREGGDDPGRWRLRGESLQLRLFAGGAGAAVGGFAGALTGRAMGRASMQAARRVMTRLGLRLTARGASAATGAGTGALAGSAAPGPGTVIGAVAGAVAGWIVTDFALLAAEEQLTRPAMRSDLLAAVDETLTPLRAGLGCQGS
ncbi:MAG: hypothetical protein IT522_16405 [Burkholderiales bacterium]|nr:hypothetical protein [Burkholderiales bacterium]